MSQRQNGMDGLMSNNKTKDRRTETGKLSIPKGLDRSLQVARPRSEKPLGGSSFTTANSIRRFAASPRLYGKKRPFSRTPWQERTARNTCTLGIQLGRQMKASKMGQPPPFINQGFLNPAIACIEEPGNPLKSRAWRRLAYQALGEVSSSKIGPAPKNSAWELFGFPENRRKKRRRKKKNPQKSCPCMIA